MFEVPYHVPRERERFTNFTNVSLIIGIFKYFLDSFVIVFINDILINSKSKEEHDGHIYII